MALTPKLTALFAAGVLAAFAAGAASAAGHAVQNQWPARKASLLDVPQKRNDCAAEGNVFKLPRLLRQTRRTHRQAHAESSLQSPRRRGLHELPQPSRQIASGMQRLPFLQPELQVVTVMNAQNFSRRSFLGAAAAAAAAAAPLAHAASVKQEIPAQWDMEADVVVLGAGGAGLMAACQAHDRGAKVVVFNKGGSSYHTGTNLCGGLFTACGSRMQKADPKIKDDWKAFADDIIAYGEHMSLKEPVYGFTKHSGEAFDWLEDHGLAAHHLEPYAGHTNVRAHRQDSFKGRDYIDVLEKEIKARKIEVHHRMPVVKMYFDEAANRVVGVQCGRDGKFINCRAKMGIVMATGGITGTPESLDRWVPSVAGKGVAIGGEGNDGSAMMVAVRDVGTPLSHMQYIASYPCGIVVNGRSGPYCRWWFITGQGGILINKNGARFITEREGICHVTPKLAGNPRRLPLRARRSGDLGAYASEDQALGARGSSLLVRGTCSR